LPAISEYENKNAFECARTFNFLAVYVPEGRLVYCTVTSPGGHCVPGVSQPLVACDTHKAGEI
jgi:hypothetical protein